MFAKIKVHSVNQNQFSCICK